MLHCGKKQILLFTEPHLSFQFFIYNAQTKGYRTFIVSKKDCYLREANAILDRKLSFFQVDTSNDERLVNFLACLAQEFNIAGIIPEYGAHGITSAKISTFLGKPGLTPSVMTKIENMTFSREKESSQPYYLDGLIKDNLAHILAISNRELSLDSENSSFGHTFQEDIDLTILNNIRACLQYFVSTHEVSCGAFHAIATSDRKESTLLHFRMRFADPFVAKLLYHAAGIDYYDKVFKLFADQPLLFNSASKRNGGVVFIKAYEIK